MRDFVAVVNPTAGGSAGANRLIPLARALREAGARLEVEYTRSLAHARELARAAGAAGAVVLGVGGDGMVGCVGGALAGTGATFGAVPAGRGNDFARQLGLPAEPAKLAELLLHGEVRPVDAIEVESAVHDRVAVLGSVYAGVDAAANQNANRTRLFRGQASYYVGALRAIVPWRAAEYRLTVDGEELTRSGYTVVVANSGYYGFGRHVAPSAEVDDGLLDVVIINRASRLLFFAIMNELKDGSHVRRPQVEVLRARQVSISADRPVPCGADGEVDAELPVTARVLPGALRIIRP